MHFTQGLVLKKSSQGEADAVLFIFTRDFGKIRAVAKGIKKESAKLKGHLELLNLSSIGFVLGKSGERITQAELVNFWPVLRADYEKLGAALRMAELVDRYCLTGDRDEKLWELLMKSFEELEKEPLAQDFPAVFEKEFLKVLGYGGVLSVAHLDYN